jgi:hypothetical protein
VPLTGVSRRTTPLGAFTFRELLAERRRAERALARGRNPDASHALLERIDEELAARRVARLDRAATPTVP